MSRRAAVVVVVVVVVVNHFKYLNSPLYIDFCHSTVTSLHFDEV